MATLSQEQQALVDSLPTSGEIDFDAWRKQLIVADQVELLNANYHSMRRAKTITVVLRKNADGELTSYVSRTAVIVSSPANP